MKKLSIITKKINAGRYEVIVSVNFEEIKKFETTDMSLIDDIQTWKDKEFEEDLIKFDTFEELEHYLLNL